MMALHHSCDTLWLSLLILLLNVILLSAKLILLSTIFHNSNDVVGNALFWLFSLKHNISFKTQVNTQTCQCILELVSFTCIFEVSFWAAKVSRNSLLYNSQRYSLLFLTSLRWQCLKILLFARGGWADDVCLSFYMFLIHHQSFVFCREVCNSSVEV